MTKPDRTGIGGNWVARLVVSVVLIDLAAVAFMGLELRATRLVYSDRANVATQNISRLLETSIRTMLDKADLSLRLLALSLSAPQVGQSDSTEGVRKILAASLSVQPDIGAFQVFDAEGNLVADTRVPAGARVNISGREVFARLRADASAGLVISSPRRSAIDGAWIIVLGRRLTTSNGSFNGIVSATLPLERLERQFGNIDLGTQGAITLRDLDLGLVVRKPTVQAAIGDRKVSQSAVQALAANPGYGTFTSKTGSDDVERSISYVRVAGYPFYLIVGLATADYLTDWYVQVRAVSALLALFVALTAAMSVLLAHVWQRREADLQSMLGQTRAALERFSRLFHGSPSATIITSLADSRVVDINKTACDAFGIDREALLGRTLQSLDVGLRDQDWATYQAQVLREGRVNNLVLPVRVADGRTRSELLHGEPMDWQGERCLLTMSADVTALLAVEQATRARTAAEASSLAKTEFLSRMSHELRTPLNAVLGFAQLLQSDTHTPLSGRQLAQVESIRRAGWHLLALMNDVLDVSRVELGQLQIEMQVVALAPLIDEVLELVRTQADGLSVQLDAAYRQQAPLYVLGDTVRLRQVIVNLVSNAVKYNRPHGAVRVGLHCVDDTVRIQVTDTGMGMTLEQLDHLFEPFNRLGREGGSIEGTGIGMALVRQLIGLMQGRIEVDSVEGRGTTVNVYLKLAQASADVGPLRGSTPPADAQEDPSGTVLYIEDNSINLLIVEEFLTRWPRVDLVQAICGEEGLAFARRLQPDLVLLDMHLPDMSGLQVLRSMQGDEVMRELRVVALSASAMPHEVANASREGAAEYWTKPLDFDRFDADMRRLLKGARSPGRRAP